MREKKSLLPFLGIWIGQKNRGVRAVGWFSFEHKNHSNREIKIHVVWFDWFLKSYPNQCG
jgi:hypothetical protein